MKIGIILETKEPEKSWNAFRFANTCLKREHTVKVFLMGEAVECEEVKDQRYNTTEEMKKFVDMNSINGMWDLSQITKTGRTNFLPNINHE